MTMLSKRPMRGITASPPPKSCTKKEKKKEKTVTRLSQPFFCRAGEILGSESYNTTIWLKKLSAFICSSLCSLPLQSLQRRQWCHCWWCLRWVGAWMVGVPGKFLQWWWTRGNRRHPRKKLWQQQPRPPGRYALMTTERKGDQRSSGSLLK